MAEQPYFLVLTGPNLNMLGIREPEIYGTVTLADIEKQCREVAAAHHACIDFKQSNHEGELVTLIQEAYGKAKGIVINAGAYTHTSIAIHDALKLVHLPVYEVHISNIHARESFRKQSFISPLAVGVICGFGSSGYAIALESLIKSVK